MEVINKQNINNLNSPPIDSLCLCQQLIGDTIVGGLSIARSSIFQLINEVAMELISVIIIAADNSFNQLVIAHFFDCLAKWQTRIAVMNIPMIRRVIMAPRIPLTGDKKSERPELIFKIMQCMITQHDQAGQISIQHWVKLVSLMMSTENFTATLE